jgi:large conductance mechanosensitive channel
VITEFKEFLTKGNLITIAVGFIMAVAFAALVNSFVNDLIMPIIAIPFGEPNFNALTFTINGSVISWGAFVTAAVVFMLTALAVFVFIVKPYAAYQKRSVVADADDEPGPTEIEILGQIRDALTEPKG